MAEVLGHRTITPTGTLITLHSKYIDINISGGGGGGDLHNSLYSSGKAFHKILECFHQNFCQFIPFTEYLWGQALMWDEKAWLGKLVPVDPKGVWLGESGLCAGQSSSSTPNSSNRWTLQLWNQHSIVTFVHHVSQHSWPRFTVFCLIAAVSKHFQI